MPEIFTDDKIDAILATVRDLAKARIAEGINQNPLKQQKITLDLTTARLETLPYKIGFAFRSFYVQDATDTNVSVEFKPQSQDSIQSPVTIKKNDVLSYDYPIQGAFIHWSAQSAKSITIVFFVDAEFKSGSQISVTGGGVSISEGSSFTQSALTFVAATALSIFASDSTRKVGVFQNKTGASVWLGSSAVTNSNAYYEVQPGAEFIWKNTAQLYGYSVGGGSAHKTEEF